MRGGMEDCEGGVRPSVPLPRVLRTLWAASLAAFAMVFLVGWLKYHAGSSRFNWDPLSDP
jgi:hypothetical protein